ncbi:MAG: NAD(P)/FAD-dependent oxidoreductase [Longimicrobiales bacterium]
MIDAVVVGAGPNGLAAAVALATEGLSVKVLEAARVPGGAARTEALTLPGFLHDVGSAVYPLGVGSPFFRTLPLADHGLEWVHPEIPLAHPLDGGRAAVLHRDLDRTVRELGVDGPAYRSLLAPLVRGWPSLARNVLTTPLRIPTAPILMARFGLRALRPTDRLAERFRTEEARALLAGNAAHAGIPLDQVPGAAAGLVLMAAGHAVGWPVPRGGAGALTRSLVSLLEARGGVVVTDHRVESVDDLPDARAVLLDLTPRQVVAVAGHRLPAPYARTLEEWRYGPGAFKVDWALDGPIPWEAEACRRAGTVHVGGTLEEIAEAERAPWAGEVADRPFVLLAQPTVMDPSRAPDGRHTAWAYCHVPTRWTGDATAAVEAQVERFAPGFTQRILARSVHGPPALEAWNANLVGGDVNGGSPTLSQTLGRPVFARRPWATPVDDLYLCSASTPPGGGVHGMCGYHAARTALKRSFGR